MVEVGSRLRAVRKAAGLSQDAAIVAGLWSEVMPAIQPLLP
jgi:transcriptional regulator with XRE-family HTH domain